MKLSATLLVFAACASAQQEPVQPPNPATTEVQSYSIEANSFVEALLQISAQFKLPLGVEWIKTANTLKPVQFSQSRTTVADIIDSVVALHSGYEWRTEAGVIHVFQRGLVQDGRNPLNVSIKSFDARPESVAMAINDLSQLVSHPVRHPELAEGIAGSVPSGDNEPVFSFAAQNAPARAILNKIVTAGIALAFPRMRRIWIATFPESPVLSPTGYLETAPVWNLNVDSEQPFWILLAWAESPPEKMVR
jgi:hypothetical protein